MDTSRKAMSLLSVSLRVSAITVLLLLACHCQAAQRYSASGVVLQVDRPHQSLKISCREIPGYMAAMVMDFPVHKLNELEGLSPGILVDFTLVVTGDSAYAESIRVHQFQSTDQEPMAARQLSLVSKLVDSSAGAVKPLTVGQRVPDFALISHKREPIKLSQFAGKVVAITFLYTHCPLPNYCYRLSNNFSIVQKRFASRMDRDLVLLSITFDPEHDQPEVLAQYAAKNWKAADAQGWYFLTGPLPEIQKVSLEFGMNSWQDEGLITHALHTVILDRNAQLVANLEGNEFTAQQLGDLLESLLHGST
jgi:protein SCO1